MIDNRCGEKYCYIKNIYTPTGLFSRKKYNGLYIINIDIVEINENECTEKTITLLSSLKCAEFIGKMNYVANTKNNDELNNKKLVYNKSMNSIMMDYIRSEDKIYYINAGANAIYKIKVRKRGVIEFKKGIVGPSRDVLLDHEKYCYIMSVYKKKKMVNGFSVSNKIIYLLIRVIEENKHDKTCLIAIDSEHGINSDDYTRILCSIANVKNIEALKGEQLIYNDKQSYMYIRSSDKIFNMSLETVNDIVIEEYVDVIRVS